MSFPAAKLHEDVQSCLSSFKFLQISLPNCLKQIQAVRGFGQSYWGFGDGNAFSFLCGCVVPCLAGKLGLSPDWWRYPWGKTEHVWCVVVISCYKLLCLFDVLHSTATDCNIRLTINIVSHFGYLIGWMMNDDCGSFEATGGFYLLLSDLDGIRISWGSHSRR